MLIGQLAKKTGFSIDTIRYYERQGLLTPTSIRPSGYREYSASDVDRLTFIGEAKELGFSLAEIGDLAVLKENNNTTCRQVKGQAEKKLAEVQEKLKSLRALEAELQALITKCTGDSSGLEDCAIMSRLDGNKRGRDEL